MEACRREDAGTKKPPRTSSSGRWIRRLGGYAPQESGDLGAGSAQPSDRRIFDRVNSGSQKKNIKRTIELKPAHRHLRDQGRDEAGSGKHPVRPFRPQFRTRKQSQPNFKKNWRRQAEHPVDAASEKRRTLMPWLAKNRLVDKSKN